MNIAVFLDRDGVLNQDPPHYAHRLDQLVIIPKSCEAVRALKEHHYIVIIISNQSGIARGYYTENNVAIFNNALIAKIHACGGDVDGIYYCPHHPEAIIERYRMDCNCRKPKAGMLFKAAEEYNIDLSKSYLVGDKMSDIEAGNAAGCHVILVLTGHGTDEVLKKKDDDDIMVAADLFDAVNKYIIGSK